MKTSAKRPIHTLVSSPTGSGAGGEGRTPSNPVPNQNPNSCSSCRSMPESSPFPKPMTLSPCAPRFQTSILNLVRQSGPNSQFSPETPITRQIRFRVGNGPVGYLAEWLFAGCTRLTQREYARQPGGSHHRRVPHYSGSSQPANCGTRKPRANLSARKNSVGPCSDTAPKP